MMNGLWPKEQPRPTDSQAETKVYEALKRQLPDGWCAWHSLRIRTSAGTEGEGDFVIAISDRGFLVLEVKGGHIEQRDGLWYQNGHPLKKAPREQAHSFARKLLKRLQEAGLSSVPFAILTIFPDTSFSRAPAQDDLSDCVLGEQDLTWLKESITAKLDRLFQRKLRIPSSNLISRLHHLWGESWVPRLQLGHKARINAEQRLKLDDDQLQLIDNLIGNRLLLVKGIAGSGKTLIAREVALKMARQNRRVLYLCFTDALAEWLHPTLIDAGVEVFTVPRYAVHLLQRANLIEKTESSFEFWSSVSLRAAVDAMPQVDTAPEVVILDEAQDLTENDWELVEALASDKICWIFHDPAQAFWPKRSLPEWIKRGGKFDLTRCYRCPEPIIEYSRKIHGQLYDEEKLREGFENDIITEVKAPSETAVIAKIENEIRKLFSAGFKPADIAILSLRGQTASGGIARRDRIGDIQAVRADDPAMTENVVADTFLRFKGLERPAIIITDQRLVDNRADVRLHIALTRATDVARIVTFNA